jgi:FlgD Ig-like domain
VAATFAAFFAAQRIKGEPPVARVRSLSEVFSPNGDHRKDVNRFRIRLRESSQVSVDMIDSAGDRVRRLAEGAVVSAQAPLRLRWDGRTDDGARARDGRYSIRVTLQRQGRSVTLGRTTRIDTRPPRPEVTAVTPGPIVAPGAGPLRVEVGDVSRRALKQARIYRMDGGRPRAVAELPPVRRTTTLTWDGRVRGRPAPPGTYLVQVTARDRAGNEGTTPADMPPEPGESRGRPGITVRGIAAELPVRPVTAGRRLEVNVDARRRPYRWRLRRVGVRKPVETGRERAGQPVVLKAPRGDSGLYVLELRAGRWTTAVPVMVQSRERARMLVVLPVLTWTGLDPVDQDADGVADTLARGTPVNWPRVLTDLPWDLRHRVAPLLAFFDRAKIRYDLTSDLDLALSTGPRASDRMGVLLAGPERWITRSYAKRLRQYVADGGRLASFGADTLRRGVTLLHDEAGTSGRLVRPTQPTDRDPFGTRLKPVRRARAPVTLSLIGGDATFGLLEGFDGALEGFRVLEESEPPAEGKGTLRAALGVETAPAEEEPGVPEELPPEPLPTIAATEIGKGLTIRVGLPGWTQHLRDRQVAQITLNIADLLRRLEPRIRSAP